MIFNLYFVHFDSTEESSVSGTGVSGYCGIKSTLTRRTSSLSNYQMINQSFTLQVRTTDVHSSLSLAEDSIGLICTYCFPHFQAWILPWCSWLERGVGMVTGGSSPIRGSCTPMTSCVWPRMETNSSLQVKHKQN